LPNKKQAERRTFFFFGSPTLFVGTRNHRMVRVLSANPAIIALALAGKSTVSLRSETVADKKRGMKPALPSAILRLCIVISGGRDDANDT